MQILFPIFGTVYTCHTISDAWSERRVTIAFLFSTPGRRLFAYCCSGSCFKTLLENAIVGMFSGHEVHLPNNITGQHQWSFFQILIYLFLDALILQICVLIISINTFWGNLSDITAKTATLVGACRYKQNSQVSARATTVAWLDVYLTVERHIHRPCEGPDQAESSQSWWGRDRLEAARGSQEQQIYTQQPLGWHTTAWKLLNSASSLTETSVRSPRKLFIFIT